MTSNALGKAALLTLIMIALSENVHVAQGQSPDGIPEKFVASVGKYLAARLNEIDNIEIHAKSEFNITALGIQQYSSPIGASSESYAQTLHYCADRTGKYLVDLEFTMPTALQGKGTKTVYDGSKLFSLKRGVHPILLVKEGDGTIDPFSATLNPFLEGLGFLTPNKDTDNDVNACLLFSEVANEAIIQRRLTSVDLSSIHATSTDISFRIPGTGSMKGRRFNYEVKLALPMGMPDKVTRVDAETLKPLSIFSVLEWREIAGKNKHVWIPVKIKEESLDSSGATLMTSTSIVESVEINGAHPSVDFTIPQSEAQFLQDVDRNVTTDLHSQTERKSE